MIDRVIGAVYKGVIRTTQTRIKIMTTYHLTIQSNSTIAPVVKFNGTLKGAKKAAVDRFGGGFRGDLIVILDNRVDAFDGSDVPGEVILGRPMTGKKWAI